MLIAAYRNGIVPNHLHGRTQHKTLGARISEDIVEARDDSVFFRVEPGKFFLREFLTDESLPAAYRRQFIARRRVRELKRGYALSMKRLKLNTFCAHSDVISADALLEDLRKTFDRYDNYQEKCADSVFFWSFVLLTRENWVLSYRLGRYRDDRDAFMSRRSIGFTSLVMENELTLFNIKEDLGITDAGVNAVTIDLDIPLIRSKSTDTDRGTICYFLVAHTSALRDDVLAVIDYKCPTWFEPIRRRLAINDLVWLDLNEPVNNIDDFDPWSKSVLQTYRQKIPNGGSTLSPDPGRRKRRVSSGATDDAES